MTLKEKFQKWHDSPTNETVAMLFVEASYEINNSSSNSVDELLHQDQTNR